MSIDGVIASRRSCRHYSPKPIPEDLLNEIMESATMAPSAKNLQPWYFVVLTNPKDIRLVGEIMADGSDRMRSELAERFANNPEVVDETMSFLSTFGGAPCLVLAFAYSKGYRDEWTLDVVQSVAAACENLILSACEKGIGSCWLTAVCRASEKIEAQFAPDNGFLVAGISLGYPKEGSPCREVKRKGGRVLFR